LIMRISIALALGTAFSIALALATIIIINDMLTPHGRVNVSVNDAVLESGNLSYGDAIYFLQYPTSFQGTSEIDSLPIYPNGVYGTNLTLMAEVTGINGNINNSAAETLNYINYSSSVNYQIQYLNSSSFTLSLEIRGNANVTLFMAPGSVSLNYSIHATGKYEELDVTYSLHGNFQKGMFVVPVEINGRLEFFDIMI